MAELQQQDVETRVPWRERAKRLFTRKSLPTWIIVLFELRRPITRLLDYASLGDFVWGLPENHRVKSFWTFLNSTWGTLILLALGFGWLGWLVIRPERRAKKKAADLERVDDAKQPQGETERNSKTKGKPPQPSIESLTARMLPLPTDATTKEITDFPDVRRGCLIATATFKRTDGDEGKVNVTCSATLLGPDGNSITISDVWWIERPEVRLPWTQFPSLSDEPRGDPKRRIALVLVEYPPDMKVYTYEGRFTPKQGYPDPEMIRPKFVGEFRELKEGLYKVELALEALDSRDNKKVMDDRTYPFKLIIGSTPSDMSFEKQD